MTYGSLFTGAMGADLGLIKAGFSPVFHAEIDKHACAVMRYHAPAVPNLGDVCLIDPETIPVPDLLWMSPPCQDLSVAGKREGLGGERSGLFYEGIRIAECLVRRGTGLIAMEQVPGLFSSDGGEDIRRVLAAFLELRPVDLGWRVLDSQWFGVAQRRRRVYVAVDFRARRVATILSLPEGVCGYPAPRREAGSRVAHALTIGTGERREVNDTYICEDVAATLKQGGGTRGWCCDDGAPLVAHALTADGFDASEDGTGRGTPLIPVASLDLENLGDGGNIGYSFSGAAHTLNTNGNIGVAYPAEHVALEDVSATLADHGGGANEPARFGSIVGVYPIDAQAMRDGEAKTPSPDAEGIVRLRDPGLGIGADGDPCPTLQTSAVHAVAFAQNQLGEVRESDQAGTLNTNSNPTGRNAPLIRAGYRVRRLTPKECERLQAWPDDWTRWGIDEKGKKYELSDGPRYRLMGNGVTSTVPEWMGNNLRLADQSEAA